MPTDSAVALAVEWSADNTGTGRRVAVVGTGPGTASGVVLWEAGIGVRLLNG